MIVSHWRATRGLRVTSKHVEVASPGGKTATFSLCHLMHLDGVNVTHWMETVVLSVDIFLHVAFLSYFCCLRVTVHHPHCYVKQPPSYQANMVSYSMPNLVANGTDVNKLAALTTSLAGIRPFLSQGEPPHLQNNVHVRESCTLASQVKRWPKRWWLV